MASTSHSTQVKESHCDVLILGAGPAGIMAALCLARMGIKARIIDKRGSQVFKGQADGISPRSMEIFEALGLIDFVKKSGIKANITGAGWDVGEDGGIKRMVCDEPHKEPWSKQDQHLMSQGLIETMFRDALLEHDIQVQRRVLPISLSIDEQLPYPVTVTLQHLTAEEAPEIQSRVHSRDEHGQLPSEEFFKSQIQYDNIDVLLEKVSARRETAEIVHAKYVIGCEGAHSWTRKQLGIKMEGQMKDDLYGVMDIRPISDFPDIRKIAMVKSRHGQMLIIPREKNMIRIYVPQKEHAKKDEITPRTIMSAADKILSPYSIDYQYCDWWTVYQAGQRVATTYQDPSHRVFLAGDAVHTHSPKEGQGMNTSMADTHNLAFKLAGVLKGQMDPAVLKTYEPERRPVAKHLINFDRKVTEAYASGDKNLAHKLMSCNTLFMSGGGIVYRESPLIAAPSTPVDLSLEMPDVADSADFGELEERYPSLNSRVQGQSNLASRMQIGLRMDSHPIYLHADGRCFETLDLMPVDGKWRVIIFAGDITNAAQMTRVDSVGACLARSNGLLDRYTRRSDDASVAATSPIEVLLIHSGTTHSASSLAFHDTFVPFDHRYGYDYDKIYAATAEAEPFYRAQASDVYSGYNIDPRSGCIAVIRPDQHTAHICGLDDMSSLEAFFDGFMVPQHNEVGRMNEEMHVSSHL